MINYIEYIVGVVITTVVGAITYLVRTVLTSKTEIELLKAEIKNRDERRLEDRDLLLSVGEELRAGMRETRKDIEDIRAQMLDIWKQRK